MNLKILWQKLPKRKQVFLKGWNKMNSIAELWDIFNQPNTHLTGVSLRECGGRNRKIFEEIMVDNFPDLKITINLQTKGAQWTRSKANKKRNMPTQTLIKLLEPTAKKILKSSHRSRGKITLWTEENDKADSKFLVRKVQARRHGSNNFKVLKDES